jgi:hypothetical protein
MFVSIKEAQADIRFQSLNLLTQGGLRDAEILGRAPKVKGIRCCHKRAQKTKLHPVIRNRYHRESNRVLEKFFRK